MSTAEEELAATVQLERAALSEQLGEIRAALLPFARVAAENDELHECADDTPIYRQTVLLGDLRRALVMYRKLGGSL